MVHVKNLGCRIGKIKKLNLKQQPLLVMECSVADYFDLEYKDDVLNLFRT